MEKEGKLKKLNREIRNCKKCSLWKTRKNAVPGEGPIDAEIFICGQSPGFEENLSGKPFVGRAGQFLNQLLKIAGIKRKKPRTRINSVRGRVFITSVLKCLPQPPINRKPTKKEIEACLSYLKKQIEIINPQKFILLGEVAFSVFFPQKELSSFCGKRFKKDGKEFFPTYHPAAGMRFPKIRKILERDFKKIKRLV